MQKSKRLLSIALTVVTTDSYTVTIPNKATSLVGISVSQNGKTV